LGSLQHIKRKITSVKSTQKITKAMKMVAAAKLKRAQDRIIAARPYARKMADVLGRLSADVRRDIHPLLVKRECKKIEVLVVTADRGLCGGFNSNILRKASEFISDKEGAYEVSLTLVGRKSKDFFEKRGCQITQAWTNIFDRLSYQYATDIGNNLIEGFTSGTFDELYIVCSEFKSALQQRIVIEKLLPIEAAKVPEQSAAVEYIYEPSKERIFEVLLPKYIEVQIFKVLLESVASELGARMTAMDAASRNASEMISKLTLAYNKTRQASITTELMDIVGGTEALSKQK
jgi:F-type H+-transporting ATPase subunit gamma